MINNMKKITVLFAFFALASSLLAQSSKTRSLSNFDEVSISEGIKAKLRKGNKNEVKIEADNISIDRVLTEVRGDRLKVHLDGNNWRRNPEVRVYITFKELEGLHAGLGAKVILEDDVEADVFDASTGSGANMKLEGRIRAKDMSLDASSGSYLYAEAVSADELEAEASSGANIEIEGGSVNEMEADVSSSGKVSAYDLKCKRVSAEASSGGGVKTYASEAIRGNASSGGWIYYKGSPDRVRENESSGGRVREQ
ncbi:MAG: head GIN domain-containing protein [Bacteroidota bacterium]